MSLPLKASSGDVHRSSQDLRDLAAVHRRSRWPRLASGDLV